MIIPKALKKGDTIGIVAPSNPIIGDNIKELESAKKIIEEQGYKVKYGKNVFLNSNIYSATPKEKAEDINDMFKDKEVNMIWCAKGGENSNTVFEYLDFDSILKNPKIICGYSDITSLLNIITSKTGLITFNGTNFKTIATDETDFSFKDVLDRVQKNNTNLGKKEDYKYIQGKNNVSIEGELIGGNLSLTRGLVCGKYNVEFTNKVLFLEELGFETSPALASNYISYMKQNGVFDKISALWIGNYEHESKISLEKIILDIIGNDYDFPIIKSNNFGHIEEKICIPVGGSVKINIDDKKSCEIVLSKGCVK